MSPTDAGEASTNDWRLKVTCPERAPCPAEALARGRLSRHSGLTRTQKGSQRRPPATEPRPHRGPTSAHTQGVAPLCDHRSRARRPPQEAGRRRV